MTQTTSRKSVLIMLILAAVQLAACASAPAPDNSFADAQAAINRAESMGAIEHAPLELRFAREKLAGARLALARPSAKNAAERSSICDQQRRPGSRCAAAVSGVEREPGQMHACSTPLRTSSAKSARVNAWLRFGASPGKARFRPVRAAGYAA